jgi:hypothetical protein
MCPKKFRPKWSYVEPIPGRDVEGDKDVDGVVLVGREDEEDAKHVADPRERVLGSI